MLAACPYELVAQSGGAAVRFFQGAGLGGIFRPDALALRYCEVLQALQASPFIDSVEAFPNGILGRGIYFGLDFKAGYFWGSNDGLLGVEIAFQGRAARQRRLQAMLESMITLELYKLDEPGCWVGQNVIAELTGRATRRNPLTLIASYHDDAVALVL